MLTETTEYLEIWTWPWNTMVFQQELFPILYISSNSIATSAPRVQSLICWNEHKTNQTPLIKVVSIPFILCQKQNQWNLCQPFSAEIEKWNQVDSCNEINHWLMIHFTQVQQLFPTEEVISICWNEHKAIQTPLIELFLSQSYFTRNKSRHFCRNGKIKSSWLL